MTLKNDASVIAKAAELHNQLAKELRAGQRSQNPRGGVSV